MQNTWDNWLSIRPCLLIESIELIRAWKGTKEDREQEKFPILPLNNYSHRQSTTFFTHNIRLAVLLPF